MNIYTALIAIAALLLLIAIVYTWMRSSELFDTSTPFEILPQAAVYLPCLTNKLPVLF